MKVETIHNKKGVMRVVSIIQVHVVSSWHYPAFSFKVRGWATDRTEKFTRRGACRDYHHQSFIPFRCREQTPASSVEE